MNYRIRPLNQADEALLWEMLYEGLSGGPGSEPPPREIVQQPEFARYVEHWGREGDQGFVAHDEETGEALGAVWIRLTSAQPEAASAGQTIPELALVVHSGARKRGLGSALLTHLVRSNPAQSAVRLRMGPGNPAIRLYERFGFRVVDQSAHHVTMRRD